MNPGYSRPPCGCPLGPWFCRRRTCIGHVPAGVEISRLGSADEPAPGDRVFISFTMGCNLGLHFGVRLRPPARQAETMAERGGRPDHLGGTQQDRRFCSGAAVLARTLLLERVLAFWLQARDPDQGEQGGSRSFGPKFMMSLSIPGAPSDCAADAQAANRPCRLTRVKLGRPLAPPRAIVGGTSGSARKASKAA